MDEFDRLLTEWEDSTENFLAFTKECCGIHKDSELYQTLKQEIKTKSDLDLFIDLFDGNIDGIEYTTELFMEKKRSAT